MKKVMAAATACGWVILGFGGCLAVNLERSLQFGAAYGATEFVFDNNAGIDLFPASGNSAN